MESCKKGYFIEKELKFPSRERIKQKPVAVIECSQEIPCNPCVDACPVNAIKIKGNINNSPEVDFEKCTGCSICLGICPGLAIFLVYISKGKGYLTIPYELIPPEEGETVELISRNSEIVGKGIIKKVKKLEKHNKTILITIEMKEEFLRNVRGFRRLK